MPRGIRVNVQADRLPDVGFEGKDFVQLGLRISASLDAADADTIVEGNTELVLPWQWREVAGAAGSWKPHTKTSWTLWRVPENDASKIEELKDWLPAESLVTALAEVIAAFDSDDGRFVTRVNDEIADIIATSGARRALEDPGPTGVVTGRTAFTLTESLTALPHPVPLAMKVWTVVAIDKGTLTSQIGDGDVFLAVPSFATSEAGYAATPPAPDTGVADRWTATLTPTPAGVRAAVAFIHPSLPMKTLIGTNPERLMDPSTLLVRNPGKRSFEASDWTATLVARIAETVDPAGRAMSVLDDTIHDAATSSPAMLEALVTDLTGPHTLFSALRDLLAPILTPRATLSRAGLPPAVALLEAAALRNPRLWHQIAPLLLAHAAAERSTPPTVLPGFGAVSLARLAAAADIRPTPDLDFSGADPAIDSDSAFVELLLRHWADDPPKEIKLSPGTDLHAERTVVVIRGEEVEVVVDGVKQPFIKAVRSEAAAGVLDLARVDRTKLDGEIVAALEVKRDSGFTLPATIEIALVVPGRGQDHIQSAVLTCTVSDTTLAVAGGQPTPLGRVFNGGRLELGFQFPAASTNVKLTWRFADPTGPVEGVSDVTDLVQAGRLALTVKSDQPVTVTFAHPRIALAAMQPQILNGRDAHALRSALSVAAAAPVVAGLMSGFVPIPDELTAQKESEKPLDERLPAMIRAYVEKRFVTAFGAAGSQLTGEMARLFERIRDAAKADAVRLSFRLVPPPLEDVDRVTHDAPPLAFVIDQLQDFNDDLDLWERLAGLGVLIGRDGDADKWWSLNVATLHVTQRGARNRLDETNAVRTSAAGGDLKAEWRRVAKVNPVPLVVTEVNGVRSALVRYESQSIVGEVETAPQVDQRGVPAQAVPRRPEALLFPTTNFAKLPPLTFGRRYKVLPYLAGHGGALPVALRRTPRDPVTLKEAGPLGEVTIPESDLEASAGTLIRSKTYPRTIPVAAPRISATGTDWPSPIPDVDTLADELPFRVPPITVTAGADAKDPPFAKFFLDQDQLAGVITGRDTGDPLAGIRIDIARLGAGALSGRLDLEVRHFAKDGEIDEQALKVAIDLDELRANATDATAIGVRLDIVNDQAALQVLKVLEHVHADDLPQPVTIRTVTADVPVSQWRLAYVRLSASVDLELEPPTVQWGARTAAGEFLVDGAKPAYAPELAQANRKVAILDGIRIGTPSGPSSARLSLRRPAASLATYDRWINGAISGSADAPTKLLIRTAIDKARERATTLKGDRALDDPAVEAMFVEVVQRFPAYQPAIDGKSGPVLLKRVEPGARRLEQLLGVANWDPARPELASIESAEFGSIAIAIDRHQQPGSATATIAVAEQTGRASLTVVPGCVYEIRIYGGVPEAQAELFSTAPRDRFALAARASWRKISAGGATWWLGAVLTLTVEVATELMPELSSAGARPPFAIDLARPPLATEDRALIRLVPENVLPPLVGGSAPPALRYPAMRYVNRIALLDQRWSWRGRPQPNWPFSFAPKFGTKGDRVVPVVEAFFNQAFLGRSDDDIGPIREVAIGRAHASGGRPTMDALDPGAIQTSAGTAGTRPVLLEKSLDYRGGVNLWRMAIRAKSRYAAMRKNHPAMVRFSHRAQPGARAGWWPLVVPDRAPADRPARDLDRPGLMLVLPLTEPPTNEGAVPPLLAVFNERMFPLFNASDGIETTIEMARHPFPGVTRIDRTKATTELGVTTTYGELFDARWKAADRARSEYAGRAAAYQSLLALTANATASAVATARLDRDAAKKGMDDAGTAFNVILARGEAWGRVKTLAASVTLAKQQLAAAEQTNDPGQIARAKEILGWYETALADAEKEAKALQDVGPAAASAVIAGDPTIRYWQETSPDPIRTGAATDVPLAVRCDGPIGYTFDLETEAGRFDHASLLVSPIAQQIRPWSLIKLRFRRLELPEFIVEAQPATPDDPWPDDIVASRQVTLSGEPIAMRLSSRRPSAPPVSGGKGALLVFGAVHEGVVIDLANLETRGSSGVRVAFGKEGAPDPTCFTTVTSRIVEGDGARRLEVSGETHLGRSGTWKVPLPPGGRAHARLVISQRPKPDRAESYTPVGDIAVRVLIERANVETLDQPSENAWLSALCLPLATTQAIGAADAVSIHVSASTDTTDRAPVVVRPVRLSDFTPGVWCQFAAVMSRVHVRAITKGQRLIDDLLDVSRLSAARKNEDTLSLGLNGLRAGEELAALCVRSETDAAVDGEAAKPQVEEPLYAVVTRFVHDAFDTSRERPVAIHKITLSAQPEQITPDPATLALGARVWSAPDGGKYQPGMLGRVRLLRVLRGRTTKDGGFESVSQEFPGDFFSERTASAATDDPFDAPGLAIGISRPIEWK